MIKGKKRIELLVFFFSIGLMLQAAVSLGQASLKGKPNIIVILADDQGYGGVSCYPHTKKIATPNIDQLAKEGVQFTQGYASAHLCSPTRAGLLTGKYQQSFGFYSLSDPAAGGIPANEKLLSEYLKSGGYKTAAIGKWHIGDQIRNHPNNRGFDYFYGFLDGLHDYFNPVIGGSWSGWYTGVAFTLENFEPVARMKYATYEYTDRAIRFIEQNKEEPFFLYLPYNGIHSPLQAPEELIKEIAVNPDRPTRDEKICAMTKAIDISVGRIKSTLEKNHLLENTLIVYLSDNGGVQPGDNWKLRGKKGCYYEGGIRVPFIVSWPGKIPKGQVFSDPVISIDIAPTVLSAAGLPLRDMQGVNLLPYITKKAASAPHDVLYWSVEKKSNSEVGKNEFAVRQGKWKLVSDPRIEKDYNLYDLDSDPFEKKGLKEVYPEKYKELFNLYMAWISKMPGPISEQGNQRFQGLDQMRKYERNYKKEYGKKAHLRIVNGTGSDDSDTDD